MTSCIVQAVNYRWWRYITFFRFYKRHYLTHFVQNKALDSKIEYCVHLQHDGHSHNMLRHSQYSKIIRVESQLLHFTWPYQRTPRTGRTSMSLSDVIETHRRTKWENEAMYPSYSTSHWSLNGVSWSVICYRQCLWVVTNEAYELCSVANCAWSS